MIKINENEENNKEKRDEPKEDSALVENANKAATRLEDANKVLADNLSRAEGLQAEKILGGSAQVEPDEDSEEKKEIEHCKQFLKGTGFEDIFGDAK